MAHFVSAEVAEGAETGAPASPQPMDINEWLKSNRLPKLVDYFKNADIEMEVIFRALNPVSLRFLNKPVLPFDSISGFIVFHRDGY